MTIRNQHCICLTEQPQGIRPGPNAKTRLEADRKCPFCGGSGLLTVNVSYDPPPYVKGAEWNAIAEGCEEIGPVGYGATKVAAVENLMMRLEEAAN